MRALLFLLVALSTQAFAQTPETDLALREIDVFSRAQQRTDPHYRAVEDVLLKEIDAIIKSSAPADWMPSIRRRYFALSEAAHAKESDAIRAAELAAAVRLGSGAAGWNARTAQLEDALKAGALGPRQHALHALEAARIYYPGDDFFISWRAAKVPIATEYELGLITRSVYEERWQKVTASFMDRQAANDRHRQVLEAQAAAEELRIQALPPQQPFPTQRPIRCTSSTSLGVTTTSCR